MAIKIQTQESYIPVEIGEHTLKFPITDESMNKLTKESPKIIAKINKMEAETEEEEIKKTKEVLKEGFDFLLGEGAFEKVYSITPSSIICLQYYEQIAQGLAEELKKRGISNDVQQKAQKYLKKKMK